MQEVALESAINSIRVRFGSQALTKAAELPPPQPWQSGSPLDRLTGIGGLPRGRLTLLTGGGTSGKLTLALDLLARATREFAHAVVIDGGGFDSSSLVPFSPEQGALRGPREVKAKPPTSWGYTVVCAPALEVAGEATAMLARAGAGFLLVMSDLPEHWLGPIESGANRSGTVVVGVVEAAGRALAHASSFSVAFSRSEWIWERDLLVGLRTSVRCTKNRVAPPLGETDLEVRYPLGPRAIRDYSPGVLEAPRVDVEEVHTRESAAG